MTDVTPSQYGTTLPQSQGGGYVATPSYVGAGANAPTSIQGYNYNPGSATAPGTTGATPVGAPQAPLQPKTEDDIYGGYLKQGQSVLDAINASTQAQIAAANSKIDQNASQQQQNANGLAAITGNFGSASIGNSSAIGNKATQDKQTSTNQINAQSQQELATYLQNLQTAAQGQSNYEQSTAFTQGQTYDTYLKTTANSTLQGLAKSGVSLQTLQTQAQQGNPVAQQTMQTLLQAYGNDPNALSAAAALAVPPANVVQSWTQGSTYNQIVRDPNTNAISVQSFDLGITVPTGWTANKVSTTTTVMQDPNNPANTIIYATDPFTGGVTVTGTGTGSAIADQANQSQSTSTTPTPTTSPTGGGTASTTVSSVLGVDPSTPLSDVVTKSGIGSVVAAMLKNEGGSPAGVTNNPGNVKYTGAPGQTDSGVKATDGGTFASYPTAQAGQKAVADLITSAASGQSSTYGTAPTLQDFVDKYTNTGSTSTPTTGTNGLPTAQYGLLANVAGFNPTKPGVDADAMQYLNTYLTQGKIPVPTDVGLSSRAGTVGVFTDVKQRADDVYFKATGQHLPDVDILKSNKKLVEGNNALLNSLKVQEQTIKSNSDLMQGNITAANINQNAPIVNNVIDGIQNALGNPDVASYLAQNSTLSNELGSLLALKNASGTTVHDKLISADLIAPSASAAQEAKVVNTLMQEAQYAHGAIGQANFNLYQQIDPLGINPQNPVNQPSAFTAPDGSTVNFDASSLSPTEVQQLLGEGYKMQ